MKWFNKPEPEIFYIGARVERMFGKMPAVVKVVDGKIVQERTRYYTETVPRFYQAERHSHHSRENSINLWIDQIQKDLQAEFCGNCTIEVWESDLDCYMRFHEEAVSMECMEARFR